MFTPNKSPKVDGFAATWLKKGCQSTINSNIRRKCALTPFILRSNQDLAPVYC